MSFFKSKAARKNSTSKDESLFAEASHLAPGSTSNPIRAKRMAKERQTLEKPNLDYFVQFKNDNLFSFDAYIHGAPDSLYKHKLIKVHIDIPNNYPFQPPKVKFIQHGRGRVHPNLYEDGKICLSILGTWPGEPWAQAMSIDSVLITIRSLLDNQPFTHEPNQRDDPNYNKWVRYATWQLLLLDYLEREQDPVFQMFLNYHLKYTGTCMLQDTKLQAAEALSTNTKQVTNRYGRSVVKVDHENMMSKLTQRIDSGSQELDRLLGSRSNSADMAAAFERLGYGQLRDRETATSDGRDKPMNTWSATRQIHDTEAVKQFSPSCAKRKRDADTFEVNHDRSKGQSKAIKLIIDLT